MSGVKTLKSMLAASAAAMVLAPVGAFAQGPSTAELEARLQALEAALEAVRSELEAVREEEGRMQDDIIRLRDAPPQPAAQGPAQPVEGFQVGPTTFRIAGFIKADALASDYQDGEAPAGTARDFYVPSAIPVGGSSEGDPSFDFHAKQTRVALTAARSIEGHSFSGYLEADFQSAPGTQGSEVVTNAYNLALRRAYIDYDGWRIGQDWSTFFNVGALPEAADFVGPSEGTVFMRQAQVRYTRALGQGLQLQLALENPETTVFGVGAVDDDTFPDAIARLNVTRGPASVSIAGMVRALNAEVGALDDSTTGWGVSASGRFTLGPSDQLTVMLTGGEGIGRYTGLGFAPDTVVNGGALEAVPVLAGFAAYRHAWSSRLRSTFSYSMIDVDQSGMPGTASEGAWSASANLFFEPVDRLLFGVEYRHGERDLFNGASGALDRIHLVAKQSF